MGSPICRSGEGNKDQMLPAGSVEIGRPTKPHLSVAHSVLLSDSYRRWLGIDLVDPGLQGEALAEALFEAPFALVSHGTEADPIFNYGNRTAMSLFEMTWEEFTRLPSRMSAEPVHREERHRLMRAVRNSGYIADYRGIRISMSGRRFAIDQAVVWNLVDAAGAVRGQAAMFSDWRFLEG